MKTATTATSEGKPAAPNGKKAPDTAYEADFHRWLLDQSITLRERRPDFIDWEHDARDEIEYIIEDSPGIFQGKTDEIIADAYSRAREAASEETKLPLKNFPEQCPWPYEDIMRRDFFPGSRQSD